jgi:hypothetical protein
MFQKGLKSDIPRVNGCIIHTEIGMHKCECGFVTLVRSGRHKRVKSAKTSAAYISAKTYTVPTLLPAPTVYAIFHRFRKCQRS